MKPTKRNTKSHNQIIQKSFPLPIIALNIHIA